MCRTERLTALPARRRATRNARSVVVRAELSAAAGDVDIDDVRRVPVEGETASVVADGGCWVGVAGVLLDGAEVDAGVEGGGDRGVPKAVRSEALSDAAESRYTPDDPPG